MKSQPAAAKPDDAIALLIQDHDEVKSKFDEYEQLGPRAYAKKRRLAGEICAALTVHALVEEEIFYPAVKAEGKEEKGLINEATVEHAGAKELMAQILAMEPEDELYDAKVKVLSEQVKHHVKEEEEKMFPKARADGLDMVALGLRIAERKETLETAPA